MNLNSLKLNECVAFFAQILNSTYSTGAVILCINIGDVHQFIDHCLIPLYPFIKDRKKTLISKTLHNCLRLLLNLIRRVKIIEEVDNRMEIILVPNV